MPTPEIQWYPGHIAKAEKSLIRATQAGGCGVGSAGCPNSPGDPSSPRCRIGLVKKGRGAGVEPGGYDFC